MECRETDMNDDLLQFNIPAKNMSRICWVLLVGPVLTYLIANILHSGIEQLWDEFTGVQILYSLSVLLTVYLVHQALHVFGGMIVGTKLSSFSFGFNKTTLYIERYCHDKMSVNAYLFMLLLPFLVLTPVLTGLAYLSDAHLWWIILAISTSGCAFDLTIFLGLIGIPGYTRIIPELEGKNGYVYLKVASCSLLS